MKIEFDRSFYKSLDKISENTVLVKLQNIIKEINNAGFLSEIKNIKKLKGFKSYYRIKLMDYRIGIELLNASTVRFILICHRKDIYKKFP